MRSGKWRLVQQHRRPPAAEWAQARAAEAEVRQRSELVELLQSSPSPRTRRRRWKRRCRSAWSGLRLRRLAGWHAYMVSPVPIAEATHRDLAHREHGALCRLPRDSDQTRFAAAKDCPAGSWAGASGLDHDVTRMANFPRAAAAAEWRSQAALAFPFWLARKPSACWSSSTTGSASG